MGDLLGEPGDGAPLLGALKIMKGRLWGWSSLHGGSVGQPRVGSSTGDFGRRPKRALEMDSLSLCGSSLKGTWREGSLAGEPEGYVEKVLDIGISYLREPVEEPVRGLIYQGF